MKTHLLFLYISLHLLFYSCQSPVGQYICPPCDLPCDTILFAKAGICPHCKMKLIPLADLKIEAPLQINKVDIQEGAGAFLIEGGPAHKEKPIKVYYYLAANFRADSKIIMVIPGAGRNGDSYRDSWVDYAKKEGALILSPAYTEKDYPFELYHLGGFMRDLNLNESIQRVANTNHAILDETKFTYTLNADSSSWLFNDFDRIFELAKTSLDAKQKDYILFGHSAGGQILHRMAIFQPSSKASLLIAANSGFYTLPDQDIQLPFGIKDLNFSKAHLANSFQQNLVLLIGELDNENETSGTLLRSPTVDKQGLHRLARGQNFFEQSKRIADSLYMEFNWKLEVVPGVGHDQEKMAKGAITKISRLNKD